MGKEEGQVSGYSGTNVMMLLRQRIMVGSLRLIGGGSLGMDVERAADRLAAKDLGDKSPCMFEMTTVVMAVKRPCQEKICRGKPPFRISCSNSATMTIPNIVIDAVAMSKQRSAESTLSFSSQEMCINLSAAPDVEVEKGVGHCEYLPMRFEAKGRDKRSPTIPSSLPLSFSFSSLIFICHLTSAGAFLTACQKHCSISDVPTSLFIQRKTSHHGGSQIL
jgi:hypothetical protein